ncbi:MAG: sulfatase-like hydrolase/transferase [Myxococcota bacterium]
MSERALRGAAIGGAAFVFAAMLDAIFARVAFTQTIDRALFVLCVVAIMAAAGAALGAALGAAWPWVSAPRRLAALAAVAALPAGASLFSGAWISRRVPPLCGGAIIALLVGLAVLALARRVRPHVAWTAAGVALYFCDAYVWRPLYFAAHAIVAAAYLCAFALAVAGAPRLLRPVRPRVAAAALLVVALAAGGALFVLRGRQAVRFAAVERTNAVRKVLALLPAAEPRLERPRFLSKALPPASSRGGPIVEATRVDATTTLQGANLVVVTVDALRADRIGARRGGHSITPNLDRLAQSSVVFERAYAQAPHSAFSLASLMTSDYVHSTIHLRHGRAPSLAEILRPGGYRTIAFYSEGVFFTGQEKLDAYAGSRFGFDDARPGERDADETTAAALDALEEARRDGVPLLLWLHYFEPHEPYQPRREFPYGSSPIEIYDAEVSVVDAALERLIVGLDAVDRPTVLVVTADHGEEFGEHGGVYHGSSLYEEQTRVPLLLAAPGLAPRRVPEPVELVDVAPTLLRLLGVVPPATMLGDDLGDRLAGRVFDRPAFAEVDTKKMVVLGAHKLIHDWRRGTWELYDLATDPQERVNRVDADPARVASLKDELGRWFDRIEAAVAAQGRVWPAAIDLGRMGDLRAVPGLVRIVRDGKAAGENRAEAARLLGKLQDGSALPSLWDAARGAGPAELRDEAAIAIGELVDKSGRDLLARQLGAARDARTAARLAIALGKLADKRAAAGLRAALAHPEFEIRLRAVRYLGYVGGADAVGPLLDLVGDIRLRTQVILALGRIGSRAPDPRIRPFLQDRLTSDPYEDVRGYAAVALGYLGDPEAVPELRARLAADVDRRWTPESLVRLGGIARGAIGGFDFGPRASGEVRGLLRCHEKRTYDVEDYLGATWCEASAEVSANAGAVAAQAVLVRARPLVANAVGRTVTVSVNGAVVGTFVLAAGWGIYHLPTAREVWKPGANEVSMRLDWPVGADGAPWGVDHLLLVPR